MKKLYLLSLLFSFALTSCEEGKENPAPQPGPEAEIVTFNFRFDPLAEEAEEFELILSQKDGKVLLDTLVAAGIEHTLVVKSADTKFDVTTIYLDPEPNRYFIDTYVQVDPNNWHVRPFARAYASGEREKASVHYTNVPRIPNLDGSPGYRFGNKQGFSYSASTTSPTNGNMRVDSVRLLPADLTYLLLYDAGKYIFAEATSPETHVDFSKAETAVKHIYKKPEGVHLYYSELAGFSKLGDYAHPINLFSQFNPPTDYDVIYPSSVIKEFYLFIDYTDPEGSKHRYISLGPTVPTEMPFLPKSDFTVIKSEVNDVEVGFGEDRPSTYTIALGSKTDKLKAFWEISLSPEETAFKPMNFLENLNTKSLEGKDFSGFILSGINSRKAKDYTHQSLHDYLNGPDVSMRKEQKQYREISRSFL